MANIRSRPSTDTYRDGWIRIFSAHVDYPNCPRCDGKTLPAGTVCLSCGNDGADVDSHPAAD